MAAIPPLDPNPINPAAFTVTAERGPCLIYASSTGDAITLVDQMVVSSPRERAICRALLVHSLALLDGTEGSAP
ncbi:hypothetical protein [Streptomyces rubiginosohelvolus]|uniref:Uncharacterized protein n=1 Tax=Streptomyces rubiginosohelvolus TaxID=67362 RepID=A0ABQ3CBE8_9ACTN|nr:hypothetical protein [Streptomyces pluricolorescens]GGZ83199.1 hypothetical protein GCM10010328_66970 [Streptomyces pluricolorescens]